MFKPAVHRILVPVTLDEEGILAIRQAMCIRGKFYPHMTLLYVVPKKSFFFRRFRPMARRRYKKYSYENFYRFTADYFEGQIPKFVRLKMRQGTLIRVLIFLIRRLKYDLVVLNKKLEQRDKMLSAWEAGIRLIVGEASCPVLTFNGSLCSRNINRIMVPVDIKRLHKHNVAWAIELALRFQAQIHLVSVLCANIETNKSYVYRKVRSMEEWIRKSDIPCEVTILREADKKFYQIIPDLINREGPDLVIIMTHQEAILDINYIGRLASEVIGKSEYPVFCITPKKETLFSILPKTFGYK